MLADLCCKKAERRTKDGEKNEQVEEKQSGMGLVWSETKYSLNYIFLCVFSPSFLFPLCLSQMLGMRWRRHREQFHLLLPSPEKGMWDLPWKIAPTVANLSAPPIIWKSTWEYIRVRKEPNAAVFHKDLLKILSFLFKCKVRLFFFFFISEHCWESSFYFLVVRS